MSDIELLNIINSTRCEFMDLFFKSITETAGPFAYGIPILLLIIGLVYKSKVLRKQSYYILLSVITSAIVSNLIKYMVDRPRPFVTHDFIEKLSSGGSPSFPSGHTADAFVLLTAICITYPRWYIITPFLLWALSVAYSRMYLGVHYPSDIAAGILVGSCSALLIKLISNKIFQKKDRS